MIEDRYLDSFYETPVECFDMIEDMAESNMQCRFCKGFDVEWVDTLNGYCCLECGRIQ